MPQCLYQCLCPLSQVLLHRYTLWLIYRYRLGLSSMTNVWQCKKKNKKKKIEGPFHTYLVWSRSIVINAGLHYLTFPFPLFSIWTNIYVYVGGQLKSIQFQWKGAWLRASLHVGELAPSWNWGKHKSTTQNILIHWKKMKGSTSEALLQSKSI